jgi:hypothetical protein
MKGWRAWIVWKSSKPRLVAPFRSLWPSPSLTGSAWPASLKIGDPEIGRDGYFTRPPCLFFSSCPASGAASWVRDALADVRLFANLSPACCPEVSILDAVAVPGVSGLDSLAVNALVRVWNLHADGGHTNRRDEKT